MITPVKIQRHQKHTAAIIGIRGKIVVWTMIRVTSKLFNNQVPYPVVIVKMESGEQMIGQLVDSMSEDLRAGREVVAVLRRSYVEDTENVISYTIKFRPIQ